MSAALWDAPVSRIIRLRGEAPDLVWPEAELRSLIDRCDELRRREPPTPAAAAHKACASAFAAAQGWRAASAKSPRLLLPQRARGGVPRLPTWAARDDVYEHPEWLALADGRRTAGVIVHLYGALAIDHLPPEIVVDQLPESWYYPGWTTAFLFRPAALVAA